MNETSHGPAQRALRRCKRVFDSYLFATGPLIRGLGYRQLKVNGVRIDIRSSLINDPTVAGLFWNRYEASERRLILRYLRPELAVIELGGSLGFVSSLVARTSLGRRQWVVEANPQLLPLLAANLAANQASNVVILNRAIDYSGQPVVRLDLSGQSNLSGKLAGGTNGTSDVPGSVVEVPATTLGQIISSETIDEYALISDIEGAELGMIESESLEVIGRCSQLFIELHACSRGALNYTPADLAQRIEQRWQMRPVARDGDVWAFDRRK